MQFSELRMEFTPKERCQNRLYLILQSDFDKEFPRLFWNCIYSNFETNQNCLEEVKFNERFNGKFKNRFKGLVEKGLFTK